MLPRYDVPYNRRHFPAANRSDARAALSGCGAGARRAIMAGCATGKIGITPDIAVRPGLPRLIGPSWSEVTRQPMGDRRGGRTAPRPIGLRVAGPLSGGEAEAREAA